jgi:hypothetical protein
LAATWKRGGFSFAVTSLSVPHADQSNLIDWFIVRSAERYKERSGSIKGMEFLDQLTDHQLLCQIMLLAQSIRQQL